MDFLIAAHTDVGIRKKTNQDSVLIKVADTDCGKVCFAAVCDGMGGLRKGELASATLIRDFSDWFDSEFPEILYEGLDTIVLRKSWERVVSICAKELERYSSDNQVRMGTTAAVLLLAQHRYFILNIGDSRVYELTDRVWQMTKDQTFIQREMDMGRMTPEEARKDSRRNVLLQCVGASDCRATHSGLHKRHIIISNFSKKKAQSHLNDTIMPLFLHFISSMPGC